MLAVDAGGHFVCWPIGWPLLAGELSEINSIARWLRFGGQVEQCQVAGFDRTGDPGGCGQEFG